MDNSDSDSGINKEWKTKDIKTRKTKVKLEKIKKNSKKKEKRRKEKRKKVVTEESDEEDGDDNITEEVYELSPLEKKIEYLKKNGFYGTLDATQEILKMTAFEKKEVIRMLREVIVYTNNPIPTYGILILNRFKDIIWNNVSEANFCQIMSKFEFEYIDSKMLNKEKEKENECPYIIQKGVKKGEKCGIELKQNKRYCSTHEKRMGGKAAEFMGDGIIKINGQKFVEENLDHFKVMLLGFTPHPPGVDPRMIKEIRNQWRGYKAHPDKNTELANFYKDCMRKLIANNEVFEHAWKLECFVAQYPHLKSLVISWLYGVPGAGKNSIVEVLFDHVYGRHCCITLKGIADLRSNFNSHISQTIRIFIDEVSSVGRKSIQEIRSTLKILATGKVTSFEKKFHDKTQGEDFNNITISTNEIINPYIELGDRRYFMIRCSDILKNDIKFWEHFFKMWEDKALANAVLYALLKEDLSDFNPRNFPNTDIRKLSIDTNTDSVIIFLNELDFGCLNEKKEFIRKGLCFRRKDDKRVDLNELYEYYCAWMQIIRKEEMVKHFTNFKLIILGHFCNSKIEKNYLSIGEEIEEKREIMKISLKWREVSNHLKLPRLEKE